MEVKCDVSFRLIDSFQIDQLVKGTSVRVASGGVGQKQPKQSPHKDTVY